MDFFLKNHQDATPLFLIPSLLHVLFELLIQTYEGAHASQQGIVAKKKSCNQIIAALLLDDCLTQKEFINILSHIFKRKKGPLTLRTVQRFQ